MQLPALNDDHRALIRVVADALLEVDHWPLYGYVDKVLDRDYDLDIDSVLNDTPTSMVWTYAGRGPNSALMASVPALAEVDSVADDLARFLKVVRLAADAERRFEPPALDAAELKLADSDVIAATATANDARALTRLLEILRAENVVFVGWDPAMALVPTGSWSLGVDKSYTQKLWMRVKRKAAYLPGC